MKNKANQHLHEISVTPEGWLYIVILAFISVGAVLRNVNLLILMSGMMIAPLIINWRLCKWRARTLSAKRALPYRVHAKAVASVQWLCFNQSALSAWGIEVVDSLTSEDLDSAAETPRREWSEGPLPTEGILKFFWRSLRESALLRTYQGVVYPLRLTLPAIPGNQQEVLTGRVYFSQRGVYRFGPAQLITRFPFGLIMLKIDLDRTEQLYVAPQIGKLTPVWDRRVRSILAGADALLKRRGLAGDDFYALRRWRSGDSRKLIHWRTSAKAGYPIVKQFEQPDNRDFAMLLDLWAPEDQDAEVQNRFRQACETCLSFAATVVLNLGSAVKGRVGLAVCGEQAQLLQSRSQRELIDSAMRTLAVARSTPDPDLVTHLLRLAGSVAMSTPLIVISSRPKVTPFSRDNAEGVSEGSDSESFELKKLASVWSSVVWLHVDSNEFAELFQLEADTKDIQALAEKWSSHVSN